MIVEGPRLMIHSIVVAGQIRVLGHLVVVGYIGVGRELLSADADIDVMDLADADIDVMDWVDVEVSLVYVMVVVVGCPVGVVDGLRIVMHTLPMVDLRVEMVVALVANQASMIISLMLEAFEALVVAEGQRMFVIVELRPMVKVFVVRVGVLDVRLVVVNAGLLVVRMSVEVDRLGRMLDDYVVMRQEVRLVASGRSLVDITLALAIGWNEILVDESLVLDEVGVSVRAALCVVLGICIVVHGPFVGFVLSVEEGVLSHQR